VIEECGGPTPARNSREVFLDVTEDVLDGASGWVLVSPNARSSRGVVRDSVTYLSRESRSSAVRLWPVPPGGERPTQ